MTDGLRVASPVRVPDGDGPRLPVGPSAIELERRLRTHPEKVYGAPQGSATLARATVEVRDALREAALAAATAAIRARSVADVLDETLAALARPEGRTVNGAGSERRAGHTRVALSPREREVLALVADGRSNKAIAEALSVSPNTVKTHVASLLHKCEAGTRVQLAAMVASQAVR